MKPRKRVLLYCMDEQRGSRAAFVLNTRGKVAVTQVGSLVLLAHALDFNLPFAAAVVLDAGEPDHGESAVRAIQRHGSHTPVLLQPARPMMVQTLAERALSPGADMAELVEAVEQLCTRKRGPRPGARALHITAQRAVAMAGKAAVA